MLYITGYFALCSLTLFLCRIMKSRDFQNLVLSKYKRGDGPTKIFTDLNRAISLRTIGRSNDGAKASGALALSTCHDHPAAQERFG